MEMITTAKILDLGSLEAELVAGERSYPRREKEIDA